MALQFAALVVGLALGCSSKPRDQAELAAPSVKRDASVPLDAAPPASAVLFPAYERVDRADLVRHCPTQP